MIYKDIKITLEFSAGAELLFGNIKKRELTLDGHEEWTMRRFIKWLHENLLTERDELFIMDDTVLKMSTEDYFAELPSKAETVFNHYKGQISPNMMSTGDLREALEHLDLSLTSQETDLVTAELPEELFLYEFQEIAELVAEYKFFPGRMEEMEV